MTNFEIKEATDRFEVVKKYGKSLVVTGYKHDEQRSVAGISPPNFLNENYALVAILKDNETLSEFKIKWSIKKTRR